MAIGRTHVEVSVNFFAPERIWDSDFTGSNHKVCYSPKRSLERVMGMQAVGMARSDKVSALCDGGVSEGIPKLVSFW